MGGVGGGIGVLQETKFCWSYNILYPTRFRTYKASTPPQTKTQESRGRQTDKHLYRSIFLDDGILLCCLYTVVNQSMTLSREVRALVMSEIESLGKEHQLKYYEQVKVSFFLFQILAFLFNNRKQIQNLNYLNFSLKMG